MEDKQVEEELKELREKYDKALDGQKPVTTEWICQFLEERGIQFDMGISSVRFQVGKDVYDIFTDSLPTVRLVKRYRMHKENAAAMRIAALKATENTQMTKGHVEEHGEGVFMYLAVIEPERRHFEICFDKYLEELDNAAGACAYYYYKSLYDQAEQ